MAVRVYLIYLVAIARCRCELTTAYSGNVNNGKFGELLKPPPPPLQPVPFHGGARNQRQTADIGYQYQPPPPPPPTQFAQISYPADFKQPFYKQYNFNFVPPPQPFTTTPSPSLFQKVSTWLFPSQQTNYDAGGFDNSLGPIKKDCNPCNLVPWIPVLRYNLGAKSNQYNSNSPPYGPPSPTALPENVHNFQSQPFLQHNVEQKPPQLYPAVPHAVYGPPTSTFNSFSPGGAVSSTYGPPSPTHTIPSQNPISSTFIASSSPYSVPISSYGVPSSSIGQQSTSFLPSFNQGVPVSSYNPPTSTYRPPTSPLYTTPIGSYHSSFPVTTYGPPVTPLYEPESLNSNLPPQNVINIMDDSGPSGEQLPPKVAAPTGFRNSYGELVANPYNQDSLYPVSATAAESTKVKTHVLPNDFSRSPNQSLSLANPAPFTLNRGRNIHTLQPVALPNLSVSPLPPIFNARPFRPVAPPFPPNILKSLNQMQQKPNNVDVSKSVPLAEFTHSVDYPTSFVQAPVIDIESLRLNNLTKAYRNIPNHFVINDFRDISSQASEDHVQATKTIPEASFESTGGDVGNDIYDTGLPSDFNPNSYVPQNHKSNQNQNFGDLRGYKDEDVDKYRTETNLQNIDSPLLYLKPSAPHKSFGDFVFAVSTPASNHEFEIYDEDLQRIPTPQPSTITAWDESRNEYSETVPPSPVQTNTYQPKIVQIIVPYTTNKKELKNTGYQQSNSWFDDSDKRSQGRKIPYSTESPYLSNTENYNSIPTTTEETIPTVTEYNEKLTSAAILNDLYDVKEPLFDIVKLQHTIDDWTEQEYSKYKSPNRNRNSGKYAKKIPDEYFTTTIPTNFATESDNYYDLYDHEGSSSNHHSVTDKSDEDYRSRKEYNNIERVKSKYNSAKNEEQEDIQKLHIYTAASSFRAASTKASSTTTTPAPWGKIQTSISPLTKEKVYVVTSKPWRERNSSKGWYDLETFESKTNANSDTPASELPFKSPRFMQRPSFGFTSGGKVESAKDSAYGFSRSWYQSINELEKNSTAVPESSRKEVTTSSDEAMDTSNRHRYK